MRYSFIFSLLCLGLFGLNLQAELIIFKQQEGTLMPLDATDVARDGDAIASILLKYQWPMCISSRLSENDREELLTPGIFYLEELFIQNKIDEKFEKYRIAFIPTCLYELFVIVHLFTTKGQDNPLQDLVTKIMTAKYGSEFQRQWIIDITKKINSGDFQDFKSLANVRHQINAVYKKVNDSVYYGKESLFFYINRVFTTKLISLYSDLQNQPNSLMLSQIIKNHSKQLLSILIQDFLILYDASKPENLWLPHIGDHAGRDNVNQMALLLKKEADDAIVANVMKLEYEARDQNKALLIRGTTFEEFPVSLTPSAKEDHDHVPKSKKKILAGSAVLKEERDLNVKNHPAISLEQAYWKNKNMPYSISFGNSLFAGYLRDHLASAYHYLAKRKTSDRKSIGYALFIDKESYYLHNNSNLFFIPPLAPLAALLERGEYFHARTKAAIVAKKNTEQEVRGLIGHKLNDPAGVILITRDPLRHAELFSKFLVENGRILQMGDIESLTPEERYFVQEAIYGQKQAAQFYKNLRNVTPLLKEWIKSKIDQGKENDNPYKENPR